ncbi:MAG: ATP synthase F0 subunit B [Vulcanimicrobiaceae bacterium]
MFLQLDGTFWVQLINFAIFLAVLQVVFLRPVGDAVRKRRAYIDQLVAEHDRRQAEASALRAQAEELRAAARRDGAHRLAAARAQASDEAAEIASEYARRAADTVADAQRTVSAELDAARIGGRARVPELAAGMLRQTLPESAQS